MVELRACYTREEIRRLQFGVMVESWENRNKGIRRRHAYNERFTEKEQVILNRYHLKFQKWYLGTGIPEHVTMSPHTYYFLQQAMPYFATI